MKQKFISMFVLPIFLLIIVFIHVSNSSDIPKISLIKNDVGVTSACSYYRLEAPYTDFSSSTNRVNFVNQMISLKVSRINKVFGDLKNIRVDVKVYEPYEIDVPDYGTCYQDLPNYNSSCDACQSSNETHCINCSYPCVVGSHKETREREVYKTLWSKDYKSQTEKLSDNFNFYYLFKFVGDKKYVDFRICGDYVPQPTREGWKVAIDHIPSFNGIEYTQFTWWNSTWAYRRKIILTNNLNIDLTNYRATLTIDTKTLISNGYMKNDCGDIRFTFYNSTDGSETQISYWFDVCNTTNTNILVKVPFIPASSSSILYMYFGNPNAIDASNFFDILGSIVWANYTSVGGTYGGGTPLYQKPDTENSYFIGHQQSTPHSWYWNGSAFIQDDTFVSGLDTSYAGQDWFLVPREIFNQLGIFESTWTHPTVITSQYNNYYKYWSGSSWTSDSTKLPGNLPSCTDYSGGGYNAYVFVKDKFGRIVLIRNTGCSGMPPYGLEAQFIWNGSTWVQGWYVLRLNDTLAQYDDYTNFELKNFYFWLGDYLNPKIYYYAYNWIYTLNNTNNMIVFYKYNPQTDTWSRYVWWNYAFPTNSLIGWFNLRNESVISPKYPLWFTQTSGSDPVYFYTLDFYKVYPEPTVSYVGDESTSYYYFNSTNSTLAGTPILHSLYWNSTVGLSGYIFSFDNCTGNFVNDSWVSWGIYNYKFNQTQTVNITGTASTINQATINSYLNVNGDNLTWNVSEAAITLAPLRNSTMGGDTTPPNAWVTSATVTSGTAAYGYNATGGNPAPSYFHKATSAAAKAADITFYTNQSFYYDGSPSVVTLSWDYQILGNSFGTGNQINITLYRPDGSSSVLDTITFSAAVSTWTRRTININPANFTLAGTYVIQLRTRLVTAAKGTSNYVQAQYDNVFLNFTKYQLSVEHNATVSYIGILRNISVLINFTSTNSKTFNMSIYDFVNSNWVTCQNISASPNVYYAIWCNISSPTFNPTNFISSDGKIRVRLNTTPSNALTTLREEYVQFYLTSFPKEGWSNVTKVVNNTAGCTIRWKVYANNSWGTWTESDTYSYTTTIVDKIPPTYSLNSTNSTYAGTPVMHSLFWQDNVGLSYAIFEFDNCTGNLVNITGISLSGASAWSNFTVVINDTVGCTIRWRIYANDTSNNWNVSDIFSYVTTQGPYLKSCSVLDHPGTYYLTQDIIDSSASVCINISANNIVLNCQGHIIDGIDASGSHGIDIGSGISNINITNCIIRDWEQGIFLEPFYSENITLINNTFTSNIIGANLYQLEFSDIINNTFYQNTRTGLYFSSGCELNIHDNIFRDNNYGIEFVQAPDCGLRNDIQMLPGYIYNNIFNNTNNVYFQNTPTTNYYYWNVTKQSGKNIWNSSLGYIGGNFWTNSSSNGYSDTCVDSNFDGFCDNPYQIDVNNTDYLPIARTIGQGAVYISIVLSPALSSGIQFGALNPGSNNISSITCTNKNCNITVSPDTTVNVDILTKVNSYLALQTNPSITIPYQYWNASTSEQPVSPAYQFLTSYDYTNKVATNVQPGTSIIFNSWLTVPIGQKAGNYNNTIYFCATQAGTTNC